MNSILKLSGPIGHRPAPKGGGTPSLPQGTKVTERDLTRLLNSLSFCTDYWKEVPYDIPPLISVRYRSITSKSNRISGIFGSKKNETVVGVRYNESGNAHIITHRLTMTSLNEAITVLEKAISVLNEYFGGTITSDNMKMLSHEMKKGLKGILSQKGISKTRFANIIRDGYYADRFMIPEPEITDRKGLQIVNIYELGISADELLARLGLDNMFFIKMDETTWLLSEEQLNTLLNRAGYLVSMSVRDIRDFLLDEGLIRRKTPLPSSGPTIPSPSDEPVIGVIDTLFSRDVYFSDWVEYQPMIRDEDKLNDMDNYMHGTEVTSIIVDGPALNPALDDGCGRFRVRHFGVASKKNNSNRTIMENIRRAVIGNPDIKVWNLSLGSDEEVSRNFISPEAAILDELQYERDVIFVVSATNDMDETGTKRIGSPADSINSMVVGAIDFSGKPAPYHRSGPVLSYFTKPDASTFGGVSDNRISVFSPDGIRKVEGTSFAAPWIARKLAYLIHILGLSRETAKALLIDAAAGWHENFRLRNAVGYGAVPQKIDDIIRTPNDEIKFFIRGRIEDYATYAMNIPVPHTNGKFPFLAKATLCYFPKCSRAQGVDYTDTELDLHFGRINSKGRINPINNNEQGEAGYRNLPEEDVRKEMKKWENVKHICDPVRTRKQGKKVYGSEGHWGFSIYSKERLDKRIYFSLVVTLKEIEGKNRIQDFIALARSNQWFVDEINEEISIRTYLQAEEEVVFED